MLITTTPTVQGTDIENYYGIVTGEAILGANLFKDFFAGIRDIVGGRSAAYEEELRRARDVAIDEMALEAEALGANAVASISFVPVLPTLPVTAAIRAGLRSRAAIPRTASAMKTSSTTMRDPEIRPSPARCPSSTTAVAAPRDSACMT